MLYRKMYYHKIWYKIGTEQKTIKQNMIKYIIVYHNVIQYSNIVKCSIKYKIV